MPYTTIHWIKLQTRLLNDPRFFTMNEDAQLFYIKFILMCAHYKNKIPRSIPIIRQILRVGYEDHKIESLITEIREHFPKVLSHKDYYYIKGFKEMHNWVTPGNSQRTPKDALDKISKIRLDKIRLHYLQAKEWVGLTLTPADYSRINGCIKKLLQREGADDQSVIDAIGWVSRQEYCDWTLETVIKKYPDFLKTYKHEKDMKEFENAINRTGKIAK